MRYEIVTESFVQEGDVKTEDLGPADRETLSRWLRMTCLRELYRGRGSPRWMEGDDIRTDGF